MKEYLEKQLQYCGNKALNSTCQLFYKAKAIGSGVFINIDNNKYLVSAAHVLEPEFIDRMTIPNGEILIDIQGVLVVTEIPNGGEREDDKIDLGIVKLTEDCAREIEKRFRFLTITDIDLEHVELKSHQYMFCGYPVETTVVKNMEMIINPIPLKVRTKIVRKEFKKVPTYTAGSKWILGFDRSRQINISKQQVESPPHPKGVSGAGLWSIPVNPNIPIEDTDLKLVGIMTDYFEQGDHVVCATNILLVLEVIKKWLKNEGIRN